MTGSIKVGTRIKPTTLRFRKKIIDKYNKLILTDPDYFINNKNKCFFTFIYNVFYFLANVFFNRARFLLGMKTSYLFGVDVGTIPCRSGASTMHLDIIYVAQHVT